MANTLARTIEDLVANHQSHKSKVYQGLPVPERQLEFSPDQIDKVNKGVIWKLTFNGVYEGVKKYLTTEQKQIIQDDLDAINELNRQQCLDIRAPNSSRYDFATTVMIVIIGIMQGRKTVEEVVSDANNDAIFAALIRAIFPMALPVDEQYKLSTVYGILAMFAGRFSPFVKEEKDKELIVTNLRQFFKSMPSAASNLDYSNCLYAPKHGFLKGQTLEFSNGRFTTIGFDGQHHCTSSLPRKGSSKKQHSAVNLIDCTHMICLDFSVKSVNNETDTFLDMLAELQNCMDLSNCVFLCDELNISAVVADAINAVGARYLISSKHSLGNEPVRECIKSIIKNYENSEHMHHFQSETNKDHARIETVNVQGISLKHVDVDKLIKQGAKYEDVIDLNASVLEQKYPSARSVFTYKKDTSHVINSYSAKALKELNDPPKKPKEAKNQEEKAFKCIIANFDVDEDEAFQKALCVMNEWCLYETYHFYIDKNQDQDRLQISNDLSIYTRVGINRLATNFILNIRKSHPEISSNPSRLPTVAATGRELRLDPNLFLDEFFKMHQYQPDISVDQ